jgi:hypothetical protein
MAKYVPQWEACDGQRFDTEEACIEHELEALLNAEIDLFLEMRYGPMSKAHRRRAAYRDLILAWEKKRGSEGRNDVQPELQYPPVDPDLLREDFEPLEEGDS